MTHIGKIARLPESIRNQLNQRLADGQSAKKILPWLNSHPKVKPLIEDDFAGHPFIPSNLTRWRQSGFLDWQKRRETCDDIARFMIGADDLACPDSHLAEKLAQYLSAKLIFTARDILEAAPDPQARWQCLRQFLPALALLRRDDMRFEYLHLATRRANRLEAEAKALAREKAETGEALQAELEKLTTFGAQVQEKLDAELRAAKKETAEQWLQQQREKASILKSETSNLKSPTGSPGIPAGLSSPTGSAGIPAGLSTAPKEGNLKSSPSESRPIAPNCSQSRRS